MFTFQEHQNIKYINKKISVRNEAAEQLVTYKNHIHTSTYENIEDVLTAYNSR